jgi:calcium binding protein
MRQRMEFPLSQLTPLTADKSTTEAIGDWHYWEAGWN